MCVGTVDAALDLWNVLSRFGAYGRRAPIPVAAREIGLDASAVPYAARLLQQYCARAHLPDLTLVLADGERNAEGSGEDGLTEVLGCDWLAIAVPAIGDLVATAEISPESSLADLVGEWMSAVSSSP